MVDWDENHDEMFVKSVRSFIRMAYVMFAKTQFYQTFYHQAIQLVTMNFTIHSTVSQPVTI